jgi:uncharacterized protein (DUF885 family)
MRYTTFAALLMAVAFAAACARDKGPTPAERFRAQLDDDWKFWMAQYPEVATAVGYAGQNARWTDYSPVAIERRETYLKKSLMRAGSIDPGALPAGDQLNYTLYKDLLQTAVDGLQFHNDALPIRGVTARNLRMPVNQMDGVQQDIPRVIASMPSASREDLENIIARLSGAGTLIDQTIALLDMGLAAGMTPPAITLRDLPGQAQGQIVADPMQSPLLEAFKKLPAGIPEADAAAIRGRAVQAYEQSVRPGFTRLNEFLTTKYLPACRQTVGADALPEGSALYAYNVRWHTTTALTPKEIHEIGLAEVKRIRGEMDKVIAASGFHGSYADFVTFLRTDPQFYFTDAASLLTGYRDIAKRADPELAHLFGRLPQNQYGVKATPGHHVRQYL